MEIVSWLMEWTKWVDYVEEARKVFLAPDNKTPSCTCHASGCLDGDNGSIIIHANRCAWRIWRVNRLGGPIK